MQDWGGQLDLKQVPRQPTKPSDINEPELPVDAHKYGNGLDLLKFRKIQAKSV